MTMYTTAPVWWTHLVEVFKYHVQFAFAVHYIQEPHYVVMLQLLQERYLPQGCAGHTITLTAETHKHTYSLQQASWVRLNSYSLTPIL